MGEDDQEHDDNWLLEEILAEVLSADRVLRPAHDETQALVRPFALLTQRHRC